MNRLRHNARVVALVIYALVVNLAWFASASAHHANRAEVFCSQSAGVTGIASGHTQDERHDGCQEFCGSTFAALAPILSPGVPILEVHSAFLPLAVRNVAASSAPWQARGPPLA